MPHTHPIRQLIERTDGGPLAGQPALVLADQGVGKTALLVHAALDALLAGKNVLHVALGDSAANVRAHYDELIDQLGLRSVEGVDTTVGIERRRMVLSYAERPFDPGHLGAQLHMLQEVAQFRADLLVVDGFDAHVWLTHGEAVCRLSSHLALPAWISISSEQAIIRSVGAARFVVRMVPGDAGMRLMLARDGQEEELPWRLDARTHRLDDHEPAETEDNLDEAPPGAVSCTLYSGGAGGAETAFGEAAARYGVREVNFTFDGHKQSRVEGQRLLSPSELEAGDVSLVYVSRRLKRSYNENGLIRKVLQTLWHMVSRSQQIFVIGAIQEDGTVVGGTGWSVELARMWHKDLWVYDQDKSGWYQWNGSAWVAGEARITATEFCGTGTRFLEEGGRRAIDALFDATFGAPAAG
jgi:hypothetical protein